MDERAGDIAVTVTYRVRIYPNATVLARTPKMPHSFAMVLVKPKMADLAAA